MSPLSDNIPKEVYSGSPGSRGVDSDVRVGGRIMTKTRQVQTTGKNVVHVRSKSELSPSGIHNYFQRDKSSGTNLDRRLRVVSSPDSDRCLLSNINIGTAFKTIKDKFGESLIHKIRGQSFVNASEISGSRFCVSSDEGQKLYQSIRSNLLDGKKVHVSFGDVEEISSAFLDSAIGRLYQGEFAEREIEAKMIVDGLSEEDDFILRKVTDRAKDFHRDPDHFEAVMSEILGEDND
jgi:hypothetical protein